MILVDSSVLIQFINQRHAVSLTTYIPHLAVCPPVIQEVTQGIADDIRKQRLLRSLHAFHQIGDPLPKERFLEAADLYRLCRKNGKTPRSSMDCLIASIAIATEVPLWTLDRDFETLARFCDLALFEPKL